ncbi:MAG: hypothetical protein ACT4NT_04255, partial [Nitrososphaerota archaeon]
MKNSLIVGIATAAVIITALLVWSSSANFTPQPQQMTQESEIEDFETQLATYFTRTDEWIFVKST